MIKKKNKKEVIINRTTTELDYLGNRLQQNISTDFLVQETFHTVMTTH